MTQLPLVQAIPRFKVNEERVDTFVNGDENAHYTASGGEQVPSIQNLIADWTEQIDDLVNTVPEIQEKSFTGDGVTTSFTLDQSPVTKDNLLVWVGGSIQDSADYNVVGTTLTITPAVATGLQIRTINIALVTSSGMQLLKEQAEAARDAALVAEVNAEAALAEAQTLIGEVETALQPNTGLYRVPSLTEASAFFIPDSVNVVYLEAYNNINKVGGAIYKVVSTEPTHSLKFLNDGRWFEIAEDIIEIKQAGAVENTEITTAWNTALAVGKPVQINRTTLPYLCQDGNLNIPDNSYIFGVGYPKIQLGPLTLNPMISIDTDDVTIEGIELIGNSTTQPSESSGSAGMIFSGSERPIIRDCKIHDFTRHGILFEGTLDATAENNEIENMWRGAGILVGSTINCLGVTKVVNNRIKNVRQAHIQGYVAPQRILISGNTLDNNNYGAVGVDISDNITFYHTTGMLSAILIGNTCLNSINNGIHVGGDTVIIQGNTIINPTNAGIAAAKKENTLPKASNTLILSGNTVVYTAVPTGTCIGIIVRDYTGGVVSANIIKNAWAGIQIAGLGETPLIDSLSVTGNTLIGCTNYGMWYRRNLRNILVTANTILGNGASSAHRYDVNSINTIVITNGGSGYTSATVVISGGGASGSGIATATATVVGGVVTAITITSYGWGYTSVPTVTINGDGTGATATATLFVVSGSDLRVFGNHEAGFTLLSNQVRLFQSSLFTPQLVFDGDSANLDAWLVPKGTGRLRLGYSMVAATTPANFTATHILELKDSAGTLYRVPCRTAAW